MENHHLQKNKIKIKSMCPYRHQIDEWNYARGTTSKYLAHQRSPKMNKVLNKVLVLEDEKGYCWIYCQSAKAEK